MTASSTEVEDLRPSVERAPSFWREPVSRWSKWDLLLIALIVAAGVGWIVLNIRAIEYGDPVTHWSRLNSIFAGDPVDVRNHHEARFGIEGPAFLARAILGHHPNTYYVAPLALFGVLIATTYMLGSRVFDRRVGLIGAGVLALFPQSLRSASQLLPGGFEAAFVALSAYFVLSSSRDDPGWRGPVLGAVFLFFAYLAKVQALFYAPGVIIAIWLVTRSWRAIMAFAGAGAALLGLEALVYVIAPWQAGSRLAAITTTSRVRWLPELQSPVDLFDRYVQLPGYWRWGFAIAFLGALFGWLWFSKRIRAFLVIPGSFLLIMTLGVTSIDPLRPLVQFDARFLTSAIPFLLLFLASIVTLAGDVAGRLLAGRSTAVATVVALAVSLIPVAWFVAEMDPVTIGSRNNAGTHPLVLNSTTRAAVSDAVSQERMVVLAFELEEGSSSEISGNAKRLRYTAVFHFPLDSTYRATCIVNEAAQLIVLAPPEVFDDTTPNRSRTVTRGNAVIIESEPEDPWWHYRVSELPADQINGLSSLNAPAIQLNTVTLRESADQGVVASLCPST